MSSVLECAAPRTPNIYEMFEEVAEKFADKIAVSGAGRQYSYSEIRRAAERWSGLLAYKGVEKLEVVAIVSKRTPALIPVILGVLMRGAVYTVIDPVWPPQRVKLLLETVGARLVIGENVCKCYVESVPMYTPEDLPNRNPRKDLVNPIEGAAIFWTSGSSGAPKAVLVPHRAITRLFSGGEAVPVGADQKMISISAVGWDGFALELWSQILSGGHVIMNERDYFLPTDLVKMVGCGATCIFMTSALFDIFVAADIECFRGLSSVWVGGDKLTPESCQKFKKRYSAVSLINIYGPVECGVFAARWSVESKNRESISVPVGTPTPGTRIAVATGDRLANQGQLGEICISGEAIACGYITPNSDTYEPLPLCALDGGSNGEECEWYRTGDEGFISNDGIVYCVGRLDRQIKVGGVRINPAEVEEVALSSGCMQASVVPRRVGGRVVGTCMMAVVGGSVDENELRRRIALHVVKQAVPWPVKIVPELPLTKNGKVDRETVERCLNGW